MSAKFQIEVITPADEAAVRAFLAKAISRPGAEESMPDGWLSWLALGAKVAGVPDVPLGWKLVAEGAIGGVHLVVPFRVAAEGGEAVSIQSAGYYVDPRWHGPASGALFLALVRYKNRFHCSVGTANAASAAVWKAFKAQEQVECGVEYCRYRFSSGLVEEALVRRVPWMARWFNGGSQKFRADLPGRLARMRRALGLSLKAWGRDAVQAAVSLEYAGSGSLPVAELLSWKLSSPLPVHDLLLLEISGDACAVFVTAGLRGHRGQISALSIVCVWGPAWERSPAKVIQSLVTASRRGFSLCATAFRPLPLTARILLKTRALDAPRRWLVASTAQPKLKSGWNGLDAL